MSEPVKRINPNMIVRKPRPAENEEAPASPAPAPAPVQPKHSIPTPPQPTHIPTPPRTTPLPVEKNSDPSFQYIIEEDSNKESFLRKVNDRIATGWTLQGGVSVDWNFPPGIVAAYRQALVRIVIPSTPIKLDIIEHVNSPSRAKFIQGKPPA